MSLIKTPTLTICSYFYLKGMLQIFDEAVERDPSIITKENLCLREKFNEVLKRSIFRICVYNSRKMLEECNQKCRCKNPLG